MGSGDAIDDYIGGHFKVGESEKAKTGRESPQLRRPGVGPGEEADLSVSGLTQPVV